MECLPTQHFGTATHDKYVCWEPAGHTIAWPAVAHAGQSEPTQTHPGCSPQDMKTVRRQRGELLAVDTGSLPTLQAKADNPG